MKHALTLFTGLLLLAAGTFTASAVTVRLSPVDITLGSYDSSTDGFGLILDDFDLGTLDASFAGVLLDVTTVDGGSSLIDVNVDNGSFQVRTGPGSVTYSFSAPVGFFFSSARSNEPFGGGIVLSEGEREAFSGPAGGFTIFNPDPLVAGLTLTPSSIENTTAPAITQGFAYGAGAGITSLTWTHSDSIGGFAGTNIGAWIVPEPSRALLLVLGAVCALARRRR